MTKGILVFANNNESVDYVKQAAFLAVRAEKYLNLPVSIVTNSIEYAKTFDIFDEIIEVSTHKITNQKTFFDGTMSEYRLSWFNLSRTFSFKYTPYDETIVMDTDVVICNDKLKNCFSSPNDFQIYSESVDLANWRDQYEFKYISETSVKFYWATVFFFRKTELNKTFFNLLNHIEENWWHYKSLYQLHNTFRNDFAFSIGIHTMNGFRDGNFAAPLPGKLYHTIDKDLILKIDENDLTFLIQKENYHGEYTLAKTKGHTVHTMNKFSLNRLIDEEITND